MVFYIMEHAGITVYLGYAIKDSNNVTVGPNGTYAGAKKFVKVKSTGVEVEHYYIGRVETFTHKTSSVIDVYFTELSKLDTDGRKTVRNKLKLKGVPEVIRGYLTGLHSYIGTFEKQISPSKFFNPPRYANPLFVGNNLFYTPEAFNGLPNNKYYVLTDKPYEVGRNASDALYSIVKLKDPITMVTELTDKLNAKLDSFDNPICIYRTNINSQITSMLFRDVGYEDISITTMDFHRGDKPITKLSADIPLVEMLTEPGLAFRAFERLEAVDVILGKFMSKTLPSRFTVMDITDMIWENGKMLSDYKAGKKLKVLDIKGTPIPFIPDVDMPSFNNLRKLGPLNAVCNILIEDESEASVRYMFIIECDLGVAIYYSYYSNRVFKRALRKRIKR